jgi:hypothetical protein
MKQQMDVEKLYADLRVLQADTMRIREESERQRRTAGRDMVIALVTFVGLAAVAGILMN